MCDNCTNKNRLVGLVRIIINACERLSLPL